MDNKENFNINMDGNYEEIIAAMQQNDEDKYEDIVSDSSFKGGKHSFVDISSHSQKKGFKAWWHQLTKGKKTALITVTSILLVIAILLGWFFTYFKYNYNSITTDPDDLGFTNVKQQGVINVALFGVDSRDETVFEGNTDSIMILSLNTKTKKVKIFSVMRDTFVPMEFENQKYHGKINSAYSKGPEHAIKTINQAFDLDISEYATVNFYGMTDIIDAVGGITATITQDELTWKGHGHPNLNNCMDEICSEMGLRAKDYYIHTAGEQTLNGVQAVAYARVRHCTTVWGTRDDFGRTDRQRHVMQELFNKAITMKKTQYVSLAKALIPCSETSLSYTDIVGLATNILLSSPTFEQYRLPPAEYQKEFLMTGPAGFGSIIYYDLDYAAKMINSIIYDGVTMEEYIQSHPIERNNWYSKSANNDRRPSNNTTSISSTPSNTQTTTPSDDTIPEETDSSEDLTLDSNVTSDDVIEDDDGKKEPDKDTAQDEDNKDDDTGSIPDKDENVEDDEHDNDSSNEENNESSTSSNTSDTDDDTSGSDVTSNNSSEDTTP